MIQRTASELAELCQAVLEGDGARLLVGPAALDEARSDQVSFVRSARHAGEFATTRAGAVIVPFDLSARRPDVALLRCQDPSRAFSRVVEAFRDPLPPPAPGIHASAVVEKGARIGTEASVGPLCYVGAGTELGERVVLHAGVKLGTGVKIGADSVLHFGVVLYHGVELGKRCVVHAGSVLGSDGFGFEPTRDGWEKVPQCGTVVVGDDVEIGANCAIDRGRFVIRRRNRLQSGEQSDRNEGNPAPDIRGDHRQPSVPRLAQEINVLVDQAHLDQHPADDRELRVVDPPERDRRQRSRHDVRQQDDGAEKSLEANVAIQKQREPKSKDELENTRNKGVEERVEERKAGDRVAPQILVILKTDPDAVPPDLRIGEAKPDAEA